MERIRYLLSKDDEFNGMKRTLICEKRCTYLSLENGPRKTPTTMTT